LRRLRGQRSCRPSPWIAHAAQQVPQPTSPQGPILVAIPSSQEAAIKDAAKAVAYELKDVTLTKSNKGFSKSKAGKVWTSVDIPTAQQGAAAQVSLVCQLVTLLAQSLKGGPSFTVVFVDAQAAALAAPAASPRAGGDKGAPTLPAGTRVLELRAACREPVLSGSVLVLVGPKVAEVALVEQLVAETWSGPAACLVNADLLTAGGVPDAQREFVSQVGCAWAFQPVEVKGLLGNMTGAALKTAGPGDAGAWRILMSKPEVGGEQMVQIGQMRRRPSPSDLELAFINANASASPLTKLAGGLRGVLGGVGKKK